MSEEGSNDSCAVGKKGGHLLLHKEESEEIFGEDGRSDQVALETKMFSGFITKLVWRQSMCFVQHTGHQWAEDLAEASFPLPPYVAPALARE